MRLPELPPAGRLRTRAPGPASDRLTEIADFGANPGGLRMHVHIPFPLAKTAPLVVVLHGCGQTAASYDHGAGWSALADALGFAVLAPEQQTSNNMAGCFNWFQPGDTARDSGEAASIRQMIAFLLARHRLDAKRIFITGLSAGGAMAAAMLAAYPEVFAGGAIIAGLPFGAAANVPEALTSMRRAPVRSPQDWGDVVRKASSHSGRWPSLSVWHGDADTTVHAGNAEALLAQWSDLHGLAADPSETSQGENFTRRTWHDADGAALLQSHIIAGMAHGAPIHTAADDGHAGPFFIEAGLSSTLQIASFWGLESTPDVSVRARPKAAPAPEAPMAAPAPPPRIAAALPADAAGRVRSVIFKALKAAGLVADRDHEDRRG